MNKIYYSILFSPLFSIGQCACGEMNFDLNVNNKNNYTINVLTENIRDLSFKSSKGNILSFGFDIDMGEKIIEFIINNNKTKDKMLVTVKNMMYEDTFYINLLDFKSGEFLFDWKEINECQRSNKSTNIINCNGKEIHQLNPITKKESDRMIDNYVYPKIKLVNIEHFRKQKLHTTKYKRK